MKTTSDFTTSVYADTKLFLKHQTYDEDLLLRPDWDAPNGPCPNVDACPICPVDISCGEYTDIAYDVPEPPAVTHQPKDLGILGYLGVNFQQEKHKVERAARQLHKKK